MHILPSPCCAAATFSPLFLLQVQAGQGPLTRLGALYGWGQMPISPPGVGSQSWLFCPLISLGLENAEHTRRAVPFSTGLRHLVPEDQRNFWLSNATDVIRLFSEHFQSLRPDSHVALALQDRNSWGGGEHLPASVQESCSPLHIMSALHAWLSGQCNTFSRPVAVVAHRTPEATPAAQPSPFSVVDSRPQAVPVELAPAERPVSPPNTFDVGAPGPFRPEPIQASTTFRNLHTAAPRTEGPTSLTPVVASNPFVN